MTLLELPPSCKVPPPLFVPSETGSIVTKDRRAPRVIRLFQHPRQDGVGLLGITNKKLTQFYVFHEIPCEIGGRGFAIHRLGLANLYHVRINGPRDSTCECLGFLSRGRCKHVQGLTALIGHELL